MSLIQVTQPLIASPVIDAVGGILTLSSSIALSLNSTVSGGILYYLPFSGRYIRLWDGNRHIYCDIGASGINLAITLATNTQAEVYCRPVSGVATLSIETGTTVVRGTDGIPCKSGDQTRRHIGTVYGWTLSNTLMWRPRADSAASAYPHLGIWNRYNQRDLVLEQSDTTDNWTYGTATYRPVRNAWKLEFVVDPLDETLVVGDMNVDCSPVSRTPLAAMSSTNNALDGWGTSLRQGDSNGSSPGNGFQTMIATYKRSWSGGFKILYPLENSSATTTYYGDDTSGAIRSLANVRLRG